MNYCLDGKLLVQVATAIREKKGLNMYDPVANIAYVQPSTEYTFSKDVTFDGTKHSVFICTRHKANGSMSGGYIDNLPSTPSAGTTQRISFSFTTASDDAYIVNTPTPGLTETNFQLEKGSSATTYNAFQTLEFPDGFISAIKGI